MKTPTEVLTAELRGCVDGYVGAPALAVQCVSALRAAGYIIVREGSIGAAQREAVAAYREDSDNAPTITAAEVRKHLEQKEKWAA